LNSKSVLWFILKIFSFRTYPILFLLLFICNSVLEAQWIQTNGPGGGTVNCFAISGTNIFAGTYESGVFLSTDNCNNWNQVNNGLTTYNVLALAVSGTNIFAGTNGNGLCLSTDNGNNWTKLNNGLTSDLIQDIFISDTNIFAGTNVGVFLSTNYGISWTAASKGLPGSWITALVASGTNIFAGIAGGGVWMRSLSEITSIKEVSSKDIITKYSLEQNYPNPFNPNTAISYSLTSASNIKLIVYNSLGQTVKVLENGYKNAGNYTVNFNAGDVPSGIYFYRLEAGQFSQVKKMMLVK
jgi:hypothetical protein